MDYSDIQMKTLMYYEVLGRLMVASHKTLLAHVCRGIHRELKAKGVPLVIIKSEVIR